MCINWSNRAMSESEEYKPPSWAGKPPPGLHLDVMKNGSVLQKLLVDEKPYYVFGRSKELCDFPLQHASSSRQHAALVYHKHLKRPFIIDLGSTHGTFVGTLRLEANKPTQIQIDTTISFGASTRSYTLRERPPTMSLVSEEGGEGVEGEAGALLGLPELDTEVDDLTQYNTAHNRQISTVGIREDEKPRKRKYRPHSISFSEEEEIINPEDVDPSIGKFRNMIQTTKQRLDPTSPTSPSASPKFTQPLSSPTALYADLSSSPSSTERTSPSSRHSFGLTSSLLTRTISAAPPVHSPMELPQLPPIHSLSTWAPSQPSPDAMPALFSDSGPRKKKYAKEAWPGKKPNRLLL